MSTCIPREVSIIRFTSFGKNSFYHFCICLFHPFLAKNSKAKLPTYGKHWHVQFGLYYGHSSLSIEHINSLAPFSITSHHFLSKNQNLDLHSSPFVRDTQGGRGHHFHLLPSSICETSSLKALVRSP